MNSQGRSRNFILLKAHDKLPTGAFVRPVRFEYLNNELKEEFKSHDPSSDSVCYTHFGYVLIPNRIIQEV